MAAGKTKTARTRRVFSEEAELHRLERENRRLSQEVAFLTTAAAYFAKESR